MKIDENLTISLPGNVSQTDTTFEKDKKGRRFRIFQTQTKNSTLALSITPNETNINVNNSVSWEKALTEMAKGALKAMSEKGLNCLIVDTVIDNIPCKKLFCQNEIIPIAVNYIFLVNDKMYALQAATLDNSLSGYGIREIDQFVQSVHFDATAIKEQQFGSNAESIGYMIGKMAIPLLLIIGVIVYVVRKL